MRVAILASNYLKIDKDTKKGTEIFVYMFINNLVKQVKDKDFSLTAFCAGDSNLPIKIESIEPNCTSCDKSVSSGKHVIFELALISKAFSMQNKFDLYHVNIGNGDIVLPFAKFVNKPILITLHYTLEEKFTKRFFNFYKDLPNVYFISASNFQKKLIPRLNYIATIYHGIDTNNFKFNSKGGEHIMWAGRAIPEKGVDELLEVARQTKKETQLYAIRKEEHLKWLEENVMKKINNINRDSRVVISFDNERLNLVKHYQTSRLFLFPVQVEEPFGLVLAEAMSCGTPVVAYAKGSIPEIIKDGETGFIVNSSDNDVRGNWIIKKTGLEGLIEAVEHIYSMPEKEYLEMRKACREHVEKCFTIERMIEEYKKVYEKLYTKI